MNGYKIICRIVFNPEVKKHQCAIGNSGDDLLLIVNALRHASNTSLDREYSKFNFAFLPPNLTVVFQLIDQWIIDIEDFKRYYRNAHYCEWI